MPQAHQRRVVQVGAVPVQPIRRVALLEAFPLGLHGVGCRAKLAQLFNLEEGLCSVEEACARPSSLWRSEKRLTLWSETKKGRDESGANDEAGAAAKALHA